MDPRTALSRSEHEILHRAEQIGDSQWSLPTVCDGWSVDGIVRHVVGGCGMAATGLTGADRAAVIASLGAPIDGDLLDALRTGLSAQSTAFADPGSLDVTVHHPLLDMSGEQLIGFRTVDLAVHGWDLARALGLDEQLDPELVAHLWEWLQPIAGIIGTIGVFGTGPSGTVGDDAPLQTRLLDLIGRRP